MRRYKSARFKAFRNRQDAVSFALRGAEPTDNTDGNDSCKYFHIDYIGSYGFSSDFLGEISKVLFVRKNLHQKIKKEY